MPSGQPDGRALLPFPPLPALVLLPFVAAFGLAADQECDRDRPGGARRRRSRGGCSAGCGSGSRCGRWRRSCSRPGPSGGGRRPSAAPGTSPTSSRWIAALLAVGVALRHDRARRTPDGGDREDDAEARPAPTPADAACRPLSGRLAARRLAGPGRAAARASRRRPACRSCSPRRSSCSSAAAGPGAADACRRRSAASSRWRRSSATRSSPRAPSSTRATTTSTSSRSNGYPTLGYHAEWAVEDLRYIPQNLGIMLGALPAVAPDVMPNTLGFYPDVALCTEPGAPAPPVRPGLPAGHPDRHRDEPPAVRARACCSPCSRSAATPGRASRSGRAATVVARRAVQPRALLAGLGPVGLPVLARLHPVPAAARRARARPAAGRPAAADRDRARGRRRGSSTCGASTWGQLLGW